MFLSRSGVGGPFDTLAAGLANTGQYNWTVSGPATTQAIVRIVARDRAGNVVSDVSDGVFMILSSSVAGVDDGPVTAFALAAPRPNPVRGSGAIVFALPTATHVRLAVLDVQGREVAVLADGLFAHTARVTEAFEADVAIPNINCEKCTMQITQFMAEHGKNKDGDYTYHHCAELQITADPSKAIENFPLKK